MNAFCIQTSTTIAPFGDPVGEIRVGAQSLAEAQADALNAAGFTLVDTPPDTGPVLLFSDRTWFTPALLSALRAAGHGRVKVEDPGWLAWIDPTQDMQQAGLYQYLQEH